MVVLAPLQSTAGTADTVVTTASERKGSKSGYVNGQAVKTLAAAITSDKFFGQIPGATMNDAAYLQSSGSSLAGSYSMWYEVLAYGLTAVTQNMYVKVEIEAVTRFEQPSQVAAS